MFPAAYRLFSIPPLFRAPLARALSVIVPALAATACASTGAVPRPFPAPSPSIPTPAATSLGAAIADLALTFRGVPYRDGGSDPDGFDCSGLVWYVYAQHGLRVPRTVIAQYAIGSSVQARDLRPGDLVFFRVDGDGPTHVGIALDTDRFVHAPSVRGEVRVERLAAQYWSERFVGARRLDRGGSRLPPARSRTQDPAQERITPRSNGPCE